MTDESLPFAFDDPESRRCFRERLADLECRAAKRTGSVKHDAANAIGAARNALALIEDDADTGSRRRFAEIAQRNIAQAERLLGDSGGNERNDLGSAGDRDHRDALGL